MSTSVFFDPLCLEHVPGETHPESPERLRKIREVLENSPLPRVEYRKARDATEAELASVHSEKLLSQLKSLAGKSAQLDPDTAMSPGSYAAAVRAAGSAVAAVEEVMSGKTQTAFGLLRPPGHHAEPSRAMGFCLFNNVAIAAQAALRQGAERVLVLDWDVHHGNGTQACFYGRRDVLYQSVHQYPFYPGTGASEELGTADGEGYTVNCPFPAGQTNADYGAAFHDLFLPVGLAFRPDLILVSAGFDAHRADPIGEMRVTERGFAAMCSAAAQLARETCGGRLALLLEGGYCLEALAQSVHACLEVLGGRREDFTTGVSPAAAQAIQHSRDALRPYWPKL